MPEGIIKSVRNFGSLLSRFQKQEERQLKLSKVGLLGSRFSEEIAKTTDLSTLSDTMIRLNKAAFIAGVPELSNQINNLGRLRQLQITEAEKTLTSTQQSDFYRNVLQDQLVLVNGEFIPLGNTDEFKSVGELKPELQAGAFQELSKRFATQIESVVEPLADGSYNFSQFALNERGERELVRKLSPTTSGVYEEVFDLITPRKGFGTEIPELHPEPSEITQLKGKRRVALEDFLAKTNITTDALAIRTTQRESIKKSLADSSTFENANKFEIFKNKLQGNVKESAFKLSTEIFVFTASDGLGNTSRLSNKALTNQLLKTDAQGSVEQLLTDPFFEKGGKLDEIEIESKAGNLSPLEEESYNSFLRAIKQFRDDVELLRFSQERFDFLNPKPGTDITPDPPGDKTRQTRIAKPKLNWK